MMQAYFYRQLVPAQEWLVDIIGRGRAAIPFTLREPERGQTARRRNGGTALRRTPWTAACNTVQMTLSEPPDGLSIQKVTPSDDGLDIALRADAAKLKPGWKGNAIIEASVERVPHVQNGKAKPDKRRVSLGDAAGGAAGDRGEVGSK